MSNIPPRASRTQDALPTDFDDEEYTTGVPRSAIRYPVGRPYVFQQGNRRIVLHPEPPPKKSKNWMVYIMVGMIAMLALFAGVQMLGNWWNEHQLDATYGFPRTYQVDQVVGHGDSTDHPTHFIAINLNSRIIVIEIPGGDSSRARIYSGPTLYSDNGNSIPVTLEFKDVNGDGRVDMIVHISDHQIIYLNDGTKFNPQQ
jgi:hypothetical protein